MGATHPLGATNGQVDGLHNPELDITGPRLVSFTVCARASYTMLHTHAATLYSEVSLSSVRRRYIPHQRCAQPLLAWGWGVEPQPPNPSASSPQPLFRVRNRNPDWPPPTWVGGFGKGWELLKVHDIRLFGLSNRTPECTTSTPIHACQIVHTCRT